MKKADKSAAKIALILGEDEMLNGLVGIKFLRESKDQKTVTQEQLIETLKQALNL